MYVIILAKSSHMPSSFVDLGNIEGSLVRVVNEYKGHLQRFSSLMSLSKKMWRVNFF